MQSNYSIKQVDKYNKRVEYIKRKKCLHKSCPECSGTGLKKDGTKCIHNLSCRCNECIINNK